MYFGYIGIMVKKLETTTCLWVYIGVYSRGLKEYCIYGLYRLFPYLQPVRRGRGRDGGR